MLTGGFKKREKYPVLRLGEIAPIFHFLIPNKETTARAMRQFGSGLSFVNMARQFRVRVAGLCLFSMVASGSGRILSAQSNPTPNPKSIPYIDGAIGTCTADFTITDDARAPIYDANIQVHISYGIFGAHKLDLQVGTNADGKARFTGLPSKSKDGLFFRASKGNLQGSAFDDPSKTCNAQFTIALEQAGSGSPP